uniref:Uncharacterized protein n=1 Tax=Rhizophora mucronata TaxID=61149 RepID=A0A2P2PG09_RHIMU
MVECRTRSSSDFESNTIYVRKLSDSLFQVESLGNEAAFYAIRTTDVSINNAP